jgi:hypothetical protein
MTNPISTTLTDVTFEYASAANEANRVYGYTLTPGKSFLQYNIEQQADMFKHLFLHKMGQPARGSPSQVDLQRIIPFAR